MREMETTMPQIKSDSKLLNRAFALFFFVIIGLMAAWQPILNEIEKFRSAGTPFENVPYFGYFDPPHLGFFVILIGLLYEIFRPTLNFELDKNWKWKAVGIFLFAIAAIVIVVAMFWQPYNPGYSILGSTTFEFPTGSGNFHTWPNLLYNFLSVFCMDTTILSLLFGFLFMTKSTPQTSKSYKIMLVGVIAAELFFFLVVYLPLFVSGVGASIYSGMTRIELLTTYWFQWDFWSELVILVGAVWLLKKGKEHAPQIPWTPQEKRLVSIFVVLVLSIIFVAAPLAEGAEPGRVFTGLIIVTLATAGFILYLKHIEKKKRKNENKFRLAPKFSSLRSSLQ